MRRTLLALLLASSCFLAPNQTVVGELNTDAGSSGGGVAGGSTAGGSGGGGTAGGSAGGVAGGSASTCAEIDVEPLLLDFGRLPYFVGGQNAVTRKIRIRNLGCILDNLKLGSPALWTIRPKTAESTVSAICVGGFDAPTQTCLNSLPGYDPAVGLRAAAGQNTLDVAVRVEPTAANLQLEWELDLFSNDSDEPVTTVTIRAQTVSLPPCVYSLSPPSLSFGLLPETGSRELSVVFKNLGSNAGEDCLISWLDVGSGSAPVFSLPAGAVSNTIVAAGQSLRVPVRATPPAGVGAALQSHAGNLDLSVSAVAGQVPVPLSAQTGTGCLYLSPPTHDFGDTRQTCGSEARKISIFNRCAAAVTLSSAQLVPAASELVSETAPGTSVAALGAGFATVRYRPTDLGLDTGAFVLHAVENGAGVDYVVPLSGTGVSTPQITDTFTQESKPKSDVLFVISNAPSMADDQAVIANLGMNVNSLLAYAQAAQVDFKLGVVTADVSAPDAGRLIQGALANTTPNLSTTLAQRFQVGTGGSSTPAVAEAVVLATGVNPGFLRSDATLSVLAVTDARDFSPMPAAYYEARLRDLKPGRAISYSVIGPEWQANGSCPVDDAWPAPSVLRSLSLAFEGSHASICFPSTVDYSALGKAAFGYRTRFPLSRSVDLGVGNAIIVRIDRRDGNGPVVLDSVDSRGAPVWTYDSAASSLLFEPLFVPEPGTVLSVTYPAVCR